MTDKPRTVEAVLEARYWLTPKAYAALAQLDAQAEATE